MRRISLQIATIVCALSACGCGGLGWYRAAGELPGVAPSDYAFYNFCGLSSQLYPAAPAQIESSAMQALGDLGFRIMEPPADLPTGESTILAKTPDGRPAKITITPQNSLTNVKVEIGPIHIGDEELSRVLFRRISLNFGTAIRAYTPMDTVLPTKIDMSRVERESQGNAPYNLDGEGLRPNENRDKAAFPEQVPPEQEGVPAQSLPAALQNLLQGAGVAPGPNLPFVPFPIPNNNEDAP
jgi:hypothetical protein